MPHKDPAVYKQYHREYSKKHRDRITARRYGLSADDYQKLRESQNGVCAICKNPETTIHPISKKVQPLAIDHDKKTGKVRGLLCMKCNTALGLLDHSIDRAKALTEYLEHAEVDSVTNRTTKIQSISSPILGGPQKADL